MIEYRLFSDFWKETLLELLKIIVTRKFHKKLCFRSGFVCVLGFLEAAISEGVLAGNVMARRASYMFGNLLTADSKGSVGVGLGLTTSTGTITLIPPTHIIRHTGQKMHIDGLDFEFMMAPDSEVTIPTSALRRGAEGRGW